MRLEVVGKALAYRWPGGEVHFTPGMPVDLPDERAQRLLDKAPGKVRRVADQALVTGGATVTWDSPLFGILVGPILAVLDHGITVLHPLTEKPCTIPRGWVR